MKYLRTEMTPRVVESQVKYYLEMVASNRILPLGVAKYLEDNYKLGWRTIYKKMASNIRVQRVEKDLVSIEILDSKINNITLSSLVRLLEYGNRDVPATYTISKLFERTLTLTRNYLGGL